MTSARIPLARSVGGAVLVTLVCVNTVLLSLFGLVDFFNERQHLNHVLHDEMRIIADQLVVNLGAPLWFMDSDHIARIAEGVMQNERVVAVIVKDRETGRVIVGRTRDQAWRIAPSEGQPALDQVIGTTRDIVFQGKPIGSVEVFLTKRFANRDLDAALAWIVLRILGLNLALAIALALVLRYLVIRPLARLKAYAVRVSDGRGSAPLDIATLRGEMRSLGQVMGSMGRRLAEAKRQYRDLFENSTEGVLQTSLDGRLLAANRALARMLGDDSPEQLLARVGSMPRHVFVEAADRRHLLDMLLADGIVHAFQTRFVRRDHQPIWVLLNLRLVRDSSGDPLYIEGAVADITARLRAERRLAVLNRHLREAVRERTRRLAVKATELQTANDRLQELDRLKSGFLSTVSHDLRTPLTSIMGFAKLISRDFEKFFAPLAAGHDRLTRQATRLLSNLTIIESEGERLTRLVNDFLDLSKIESGRAEWRDAPLDTARVVRRAVDAVSGDFEAKPEVLLDVDMSDALPMLYMDQDRLSQILVNLLGNAIKFTDVGFVRLRSAVCDGMVRLEVMDSGQGVPRESLEKIFDKFHQAEGGDTVQEGQRRKGTGLGLAICRQIVEHYGGRIWAESELGRGSTFIVELPVKPDLSTGN